MTEGVQLDAKAALLIHSRNSVDSGTVDSRDDDNAPNIGKVRVSGLIATTRDAKDAMELNNKGISSLSLRKNNLLSLEDEDHGNPNYYTRNPRHLSVPENDGAHFVESNVFSTRPDNPHYSFTSPAISTTSNFRNKFKHPNTPNFKSFFFSDSSNKPNNYSIDEQVDNAGNQPNDTENNNGEAVSPESTWLKKFTNSEQNFNEWKSNLILSFKNKRKQLSVSHPYPQTPKLGLKKKEKYSESDRLARDRANNLIGSLMLGYPASNLVSSIFLLDDDFTRRAPLLPHLIGIRVYAVTENYQNRKHHHHNGHHYRHPSFSVNNKHKCPTPNQSHIENGSTKVREPKLEEPLKEVPVKRRKYRFDLEYGVGDNRAKWSIIRSYKDIANLALRAKLMATSFTNGGFNFTKNKLELPVFPKLKDAKYEDNSFLSSDSESESLPPSLNQCVDPNNSVHDNTLPPINKDNAQSNKLPETRSLREEKKKVMIDMLSPVAPETSDNSIISNFEQLIPRISNTSSQIINGRTHNKEICSDEQEFTQKLEKYFKDLFTVTSLTPQSNRIFQFLELSPIGVLLSNETGYKGKQGYLLIATSAKKQGWRVGHLKASELGAMIKRHTTTKWFAIRESYIFYTSDINSTTILDVFLVDSGFEMKYGGDTQQKDSEVVTMIAEMMEDSEEDEDQIMDEEAAKHEKFKNSAHLTITLENNERKLKMIAKSTREMKSWVSSIKIMLSKTEWASKNRFGSFAPIRNDCFAQWFVDARDYMWAASSAIEMAKDVVFIHDWWLSPELYLRRPANGNQEWRIDRLLKRKAEQGVKIFIIIYRNIGEFVVIDSSWTKHSLMDLHENIRVLRSPNQFLQNTFFWAHHEKLLIIDHTISFLGGIDLCYGRFDTPDHVLVDDSPYAFADGNSPANRKYQIFPGKDYSNPRMKDFFELDKPYEDMYDRMNVPRMPWHDVHMVTAGQIARDLSRHFIQRWNYLIRQKRPSRPTPLLTPPTNLTNEEVEDLGFKGACEIQLLRSSCYWSLGLKEDEHSIQNAYLKLIETSLHYIYIENQFFVTSCSWDNVVIKNRIGDALVDRIIRAHAANEPWKAIIVIPLMPGFEAQVDEPEGSSIRVILKCQYMSISRGSTSIFAKLSKLGIDPDRYIQFFSLRKYGKIGEHGKLISEQLYIHSKCLIVDDRIAIIGSANINERSMRGNRDSEVCAIVRDKEMVKSTMNGNPYMAGKFAYSLRMRLMREHLGIDVDILELVERQFSDIEQKVRGNHDKSKENNVTGIYSNEETKIYSAMVELASREVLNMNDGTKKWKLFRKTQISNADRNGVERDGSLYKSFNHRAYVENIGIREKKQFSSDPRIKNNEVHREDVAGEGYDNLKSEAYNKWKTNSRRILKRWAMQSANSEKLSKIFVPNIEKVKEYLEPESDELNGEITDEEMTVRDIERWEMLKRVVYLKRLSRKHDKTQIYKNVSVPVPQSATSKSFDNKRELNHNKESTSISISEVRDVSNEGTLQSSKNIISEKTSPIETSMDNQTELPSSTAGNSSGYNSGITDTNSPVDKDIPVISLTDDEIESLILNDLKLNKPKFIDPYAFSDPLDDEFYEDLWFETAHRNTKIFRLVFHCQPDDEVNTWSEYKNYNKLMKAFSMSQDFEIENIKEFARNTGSFDVLYINELLEDDPEELDEELNDSKPNKSKKIKRSIRIDNDFGSIGMLGLPPKSEDPNFNNTNHDTTDKSKKKVAKMLRKLKDENSTLGSSISNVTANSFKQKSSDTNENTISHQIKVRRPTVSRRLKLLKKEVIFDKETAEKLLSNITGNLVLFPVNWLAKELENNNWFTNSDRVPPIEIYD